MDGFRRGKAEWAILGLVLIFGLLHVAFNIYPIVRNEKLPFTLLVPVFAAFALGHALVMLGWRRALPFFALAAATSLIIEVIGTTTFLLFGAYAYGDDVIGFKLFGEVPFTIPLAWATILYTCYVLANLMVDGQPTPRVTGTGLGRLAWLAVITAVMMTAYDMVMDPYMVDFMGAWTWYCPGSTPDHLIPDCSQGGPPCCDLHQVYAYFGIPLSNFGGWFGGALVNIGIYRLLERRIRLQPLVHVTRWVAAMPIVTYLWLCVSDVALAHPTETMLISPLALGVPILVSATRLFEWRRVVRPGADRAGEDGA